MPGSCTGPSSQDRSLIVHRADEYAELPVVVSIPHFGTDPLPGIDAGFYRAPEYEAFPYGYTDPFASRIYGALHQRGATVIATALSRLFVDVNRARDSFEVVAGAVHSNRGVIRTHIRGDEALFREPLTEHQAEHRLRQYYDPFHEAVSGQIARLRRRHRRVVLLDAHTASARHLGDHEVVIGTGRGRTCSSELVDGIFQIVRDAGFECSLDVPGYSGGHLVRRHGATAGPLQAFQLEFNSGLIMRGSRQEYAQACRDGDVPAHDAPTLARCISCVNAMVKWLGNWGRNG